MVQLQTDAAGHINYGSSSDGIANAAPTLSAFSSTWGNSATGIVGDDTAGVVSFTAGATPAAGTVVTVTFAKPYAKAPRAVLVQGAASDASAGPLFFATAVTQTGFTISAAAGATKTYAVNYVVIGA